MAEEICTTTCLVGGSYKQATPKEKTDQEGTEAGFKEAGEKGGTRQQDS